MDSEVERINGSDTSVVFKAFLIGAGVGAAAALLWAPARGRDTRDYLGRKVRDGQARAQVAARKGREIYTREAHRLGVAVKEGRARLTNITTHAEAAAEDVRGAAGRVAEHARQAVGEVQESSRQVAAEGRDAVARLQRDVARLKHE